MNLFVMDLGMRPPSLHILDPNCQPPPTHKLQTNFNFTLTDLCWASHSPQGFKQSSTKQKLNRRTVKT